MVWERDYLFTVWREDKRLWERDYLFTVWREDKRLWECDIIIFSQLGERTKGCENVISLSFHSLVRRQKVVRMWYHYLFTVWREDKRLWEYDMIIFSQFGERTKGCENVISLSFHSLVRGQKVVRMWLSFHSLVRGQKVVRMWLSFHSLVRGQKVWWKCDIIIFSQFGERTKGCENVISLSFHSLARGQKVVRMWLSFHSLVRGQKVVRIWYHYFFIVWWEDKRLWECDIIIFSQFGERTKGCENVIIFSQFG